MLSNGYKYVLDSHFGDEGKFGEINTNFAVYNETEILIFSIECEEDKQKFCFKKSFCKLSSCTSVSKICGIYINWDLMEIMAAVLLQQNDIILMDHHSLSNLKNDQEENEKIFRKAESVSLTKKPKTILTRFTKDCTRIAIYADDNLTEFQMNEEDRVAKSKSFASGRDLQE